MAASMLTAGKDLFYAPHHSERLCWLKNKTRVTWNYLKQTGKSAGSCNWGGVTSPQHGWKQSNMWLYHAQGEGAFDRKDDLALLFALARDLLGRASPWTFWWKWVFANGEFYYYFKTKNCPMKVCWYKQKTPENTTKQTSLELLQRHKMSSRENTSLTDIKPKKDF